jgi:purine-binding chemotaxis protein CheW
MGSNDGAKKSDGGGDRVQVCSVHVGETLYGIPIGHILEIVGGARIQKVPLAPEFVGGLLLYRGDVLTTVSLRWLLGLAASESSQDLLVVESNEGPFGLVVDAVKEVLTVSGADFEPNPSTVSKDKQALFAGAYKLKAGLMVMLDLDRLQPLRLAMAG